MTFGIGGHLELPLGPLGRVPAAPDSGQPVRAGDTTLGPSTIKVLRVISLLDPAYGGTSEASVSECIAAQRCGVDNTFAFATDSQLEVTTREAQERLVGAGVVVKPFKVLPLARFHSRRWGLSGPLCWWLIRHARRYDIIHIHQTWGLPQLTALAAAVLFRRPCVITPHESLTTYDVEREKQALKRCLKRAYLRHASLTIFASELESMDSVGVDHRRATLVLPHPIRDEVAAAGLSGSRAASSRRATESTRELTVGFLGRLHPKKNLDLLIDAIAMLDGNVRLRIAGDGPAAYKASLVAQVERVGIADRVDWLGFVDRSDHAQFFSTIDVLAMVSEYECFGIAASEAMAHGVAVVVSGRTGVAPLVRHYDCGIVVNADLRAVAAAMRRLSSDRELLSRLSAEGPIAVHDKLSTRAYGEAVRHRYGQLMRHRVRAQSQQRQRLSAARGAARAAAATLRGRLPARYDHYANNWDRDFWSLAAPGLKPGTRVLDVGSGRTPSLPPHRRPQGATYVGLDLYRSELNAAPPGSYDEIVVGDICEHLAALDDRFDLVLSWQVLEHVASLDRALANMHAYLREGGHAAVLLSGRYSVFGVINRILPQRVGTPLVARIMGRDPETIFPAPYDQCHPAALERLLTSWSAGRVLPLWNGAGYFDFLRPLQAGYIFYEEWAAGTQRDKLATHYLLQLTK